MRKLLIGAAAAVGLLATDSTASAQYRKTLIQNSGNGVNNTIVARGGNPGFFPGGQPGFGHHAGYGFPDQGYGYQPAGYGYPGGGFGGGGFLADRPVLGGIAKTIIQNSGNGVGNTIVAGGGRGGYGGYGGYNGSFPGGGVFPGGVNIGVITNSGNGAGNRIVTGGGAPGGLNINVITNSGNGVGNVIRAR